MKICYQNAHKIIIYPHFKVNFDDNEMVRNVFNWLIHDYLKYDIENYLPANLLVEQENKVKNYPSNVLDADMTNVENMKTKEKLTERWEEIND